MVIVTATATLDDCTIIVKTTPNAKNSRTDRKPMFE